MISVREMLKLPALSGSYLLAGQNGLDRKIKYLDILEVPDAENWLAPDEFLLTTAFAFKDSEDGLKKIITAGADKKVAGFGIKLGRYINVLPEQVIQIANSYSMPIISLPTHIPYVEIIKEVMSKIIKSDENTEKSIEKTDLLIQLINDETETAFDELESFGWERGTPIRIGLLSSSPCFSDEEIALFRYILLKSDLDFILASQQDDIFILLRDTQIGNLHNAIHSFENRLKRKKILLSLSEPRPFSKCIRHCLYEAKIAIKIAKILGYSSCIIPFSDVKLLSLILEHPQIKDLVLVASNMLSPLIEHDNLKGSELFETLKVYLESGRNQQTASSLLNIHRNTLKYRINQIEDLLGNQYLADQNTPLLWLAIFLCSTLHNKTDFD